MFTVKNHKLNIFNSGSASLGWRVVVVFFSSALFLTIIFTVINYNKKLKDQVDNLNDRLDQIQSGFIDSLTNSLWKLDEEQTHIILESILRQEDVELVKITDKEKVLYELGSQVSKKDEIFRIYPLMIDFEGEKRHLGDLEITASQENMVKLLSDEIKFDILIEFIKVFLFIIFTFLYTKLLITRHLDNISEFFKKNNIYKSQKKLVLNREFEILKSDEDNFDVLVDSINHMIEQLHGELQERKKIENELTRMNEVLEKRVEEKTKELLETDRIEAVVEMSAGIAHEINSPLSVVYSLNKRLKKMVEEGQFDHEKVIQMNEIFDKSIAKIFKITNAIQMLSQVSIVEAKDIVDVKTMLNNTMKGIIEIFKSSIKIIKYDCKFLSKDIKINERIFYQLIYLLFHIRSNSQFKKNEDSWVHIEFFLDNNILGFTCYDNGQRLSNSEKAFLYNPFKSKEKRDRGSLLILGTFSSLAAKLGAKIILDHQNEDIFLQMRIPTEEV